MTTCNMLAKLTSGCILSALHTTGGIWAALFFEDADARAILATGFVKITFG